MSKHTPGPWHVGGASGGVFSKQKFVASVYGDDPECKPDDRLLANARLIAAAPDLLEACKAALSDDQPYIEKCKAAIAKATGEQV